MFGRKVYLDDLSMLLVREGKNSQAQNLWALSYLPLELYERVNIGKLSGLLLY